ncbi:MAG: 3-deoxy-manno-octulosonate cytidylyltransferase [Paludibacteraceae bacterium]|nr:3-deoxy-manno-octulosonate cytidylyltransferase [Paludibacteraceae bacterium]
MKFLTIIPARYASSRFPGKPLALIGHKPMIQLVYEQVKKETEDVYVATDDERIFDVVNCFGGNVVMTSADHRSGTDRCFEAYQRIAKEVDVVINVQGDEPFVQPEQIGLLKNCFSDPITEIATLVKPFSEKDTIDSLSSPNTPKVVINNRMEAIYFSRSVIPYLRGIDRLKWLQKGTFYKHIGMYAYRVDVLEQITRLEATPLELSEKLEQLRWIENGFRIKVGITNSETMGVDTPEDLQKANEFFFNSSNK